MNRIQIEITLGILAVLATSVFLALYGAREDDRMAEWSKGQTAQSIEVGAYLFENNCSSCHGKRGEGTPGLCPPLNDGYFFTDRLKDVGWSGTLEDYIVATVSSGRLTSTRPEQYAGGGRPAMPTWSDAYGGPLRDDQIRDIAKFILNWESSAKGSYVPAPAPEAAAAAQSDDPVVRGQAVYLANGCGGCHALGNLSAGAVGPALTKIGEEAATLVPGQSAEEYIRTSIINPQAFIASNCPSGACPENLMPQTFGTQLTEAQLNDLVAFLLAQK